MPRKQAKMFFNGTFIWHLCALLVLAFIIDGVKAARMIEIDETNNQGNATDNSGNRRRRSVDDIVSNLNLGNKASLKIVDSLISVQGNTKKKLAEVYKDRVVFSTGLDLETDCDGDTSVVTGDMAGDIDADLGDIEECELPKAKAKEIAFKRAGLNPKKVQLKRADFFKYVFIDEDSKARWTVEVELSVILPNGKFTRPAVFIDACTEEVLDYFDYTGGYNIPSLDLDGDLWDDWDNFDDWDNIGSHTDGPDSYGVSGNTDSYGATGYSDSSGGSGVTDSYDGSGVTDSSGGSGVTDSSGGSGVTDSGGSDSGDGSGGSDSGDGGSGDEGPSGPTMSPPSDKCDVEDIAGNPKRKVSFGPGKFCLGPMRRSTDGKRCYLENKYVKTVDLKNTEDEEKTKIASFECSKGYDDEINGGFSPILDVFFFTTASARIYREWYDYAPLSDPIPYAKAHYGRNYDNAYWDGTSMVFGDGDGQEVYPLTGLDTVAHELGHGVTERASNLVYRGQSGGMNEAFSDMAGEATEQFLFGETDWLSGVEMYVAPNMALRYFDDPTKDGSSIKHVKQYENGMDVHYSSGVYNRVFYIMGKKLGVRAAFECFLTANRMYWRADTDFEKGACGVLRGAYDGGHDMEVVVKAFKDVGITFKHCPDPSKLITAELKVGVPQLNLVASATIQPLFKINVPSDKSKVVITSAPGLNVALSSSWKREDEPIASGSGVVTADADGGSVVYARFYRGTYDRTAGYTASVNFA